jgi:hypothetical protein
MRIDDAKGTSLDVLEAIAIAWRLPAEPRLRLKWPVIRNLRSLGPSASRKRVNWC